MRESMATSNTKSKTARSGHLELIQDRTILDHPGSVAFKITKSHENQLRGERMLVRYVIRADGGFRGGWLTKERHGGSLYVYAGRVGQKALSRMSNVLFGCSLHRSSHLERLKKSSIPSATCFSDVVYIDHLTWSASKSQQHRKNGHLSLRKLRDLNDLLPRSTAPESTISGPSSTRQGMYISDAVNRQSLNISSAITFSEDEPCFGLQSTG
jgi:hypothetical protein